MTDDPEFSASFGFDNPELPSFVIERSGIDGRITLNRKAREEAAEAGMTDEEMARFLLDQQRKRELGHTQ